MQTIKLKDHKSVNDPTARIVREKRGYDRYDWTVYAVRGGFVITFPGSSPLESLTFDGLFASEQLAIEAFDTHSSLRNAA